MITDPPEPAPNIKQTVEKLLGQVVWISPLEGFVVCPGQSLHTRRAGNQDCKIYLDNVPTITCFHASCTKAIDVANRRLRRELSTSGQMHPAATAGQGANERQHKAELKRREMVRQRSSNSLDVILKKFPWEVADIQRGSPGAIPTEPRDHWRSVVGLFQPNDVIWIGDVYDSGKPENAGNFRSREDWLSLAVVPGPFTCPSTFKIGSSSRGNEALVQRRFLVVESDTLTKDQVGAVFRWLREEAELRLRAIVDTGGKSLHGWFDDPNPDEWKDLRLVLPELQCDPKLFTPSQPVRLPGAFRGESSRFQQLLFIDNDGRTE